MEKKLGLSALTALVLSSMLGAGVFSLPQNMAAVASPAALLIGWASYKNEIGRIIIMAKRIKMVKATKARDFTERRDRMQRPG